LQRSNRVESYYLVAVTDKCQVVLICSRNQNNLALARHWKSNYAFLNVSA